MEMTVVVTRNAPDRVRLWRRMYSEVARAYTGPGMSHGVRTRVWAVLDDWWPHFPESSVLMTWPDKRPSGAAVLGVGRAEGGATRAGRMFPCAGR